MLKMWLGIALLLCAAIITQLAISAAQRGEPVHWYMEALRFIALIIGSGLMIWRSIDIRKQRSNRGRKNEG